jgi:hypothetical protein
MKTNARTWSDLSVASRLTISRVDDALYGVILDPSAANGDAIALIAT